jgi:hypothetical protein
LVSSSAEQSLFLVEPLLARFFGDDSFTGFCSPPSSVTSADAPPFAFFGDACFLAFGFSDSPTDSFADPFRGDFFFGSTSSPGDPFFSSSVSLIFEDAATAAARLDRLDMRENGDTEKQRVWIERERGNDEE